MSRTREQVGLPLRELLRERVDSKVDFLRWPKRLSGGGFSATYQFQLTNAPPEWSTALVLRMVTLSSTQLLLEAALQDGAQAGGVPAPAVRLIEPTFDVLGAPFMVMEKVTGHGFVRGIRWDQFVRSFPGLLASWPGFFVKTMTVLNRANIDPVLAALDRLGVPTQDALTTRHLAWIDQALGAEPVFADLLTWLRVHQPELPERLSLVHGDLWPANVLIKGGAISGLVDWTMGAIGDPALDVGFAKVGIALMPEPFPPPPPIRNGIRAAGVSIAARMGERASDIVGDADRVAYFEALRCAAELATVHVERRAGRRAGWEHGVRALIRHIEKVTPLQLGWAAR
jgi:aminoglycoside phosphotransferase (APT) family kinase protein